MQYQERGVRFRFIETYAQSTNNVPLSLGLQDLTNPELSLKPHNPPGKDLGRSVKMALLQYEIKTGMPTNVFYFKYLRGRLEPDGKHVIRAGLCYQADLDGIIDYESGKFI